MADCLLCGQAISGKWGKRYCSIKCGATNASRIYAASRKPVARYKSCKKCLIEFLVKEPQQKFCSHSCSATHSNTSRGKPRKCCLNGCGKQMSENATKCCSTKCWCEYSNKEFIRKWQGGEISGAMINVPEKLATAVRRYVLAKFEYRCTKCGWGEVNRHTGKVPVQVHHVNGNPRDHAEENMTVLCPNCHSLTGTYGALNKGSGREMRRRQRMIARSNEIEQVVNYQCFAGMAEVAMHRTRNADYSSSTLDASSKDLSA